MKRYTTIFVLVISLSLFAISGCKSEEVKAVEEMIANLGLISYESKDLIREVQNAYADLSEEDASKVSNLEILEQKIEEYMRAQVEEAISMIEDIGKVTIESEISIRKAEQLYFTLSKENQDKVYNSRTLEESREEYDELLKRERETINEKKEKTKEDKGAREEENIREIIKNSLIINSFYATEPDRYGGVEVVIDYKNASDKTIKYIDFTIRLKNKVGDFVTDKRNYGIFSCEDTGPYSKGEGRGSDWYWGKFYVNVPVDPIMTGIDIEYTDGTKLNISSDQIKYLGLSN